MNLQTEILYANYATFYFYSIVIAGAGRCETDIEYPLTSGNMFALFMQGQRSLGLGV